ncbi:MAG: hypothetical protein GX045_11590 [Clostridiaceae bacterium]|jgi:hypothetical protein|nr:hypothetical protein [Clostridiaceae bacterium]
MNTCYYPQHGYYYSHGCPYRDTCPVRAQCPYCPHRYENNNYMNPGMWNANMGMHYYNNAFVPMCCPNLMYENYGYDNLYPMTNVYPEQMPETYNNMMSGYNKYGYISPNENINNPWDNNRMYVDQNTN